MSLVTINVGSNGQPYTVSQMRRRLAQILSKLDGGQEISFSFVGVLEYYRPTGIGGYNCLRPACVCTVSDFHLRHPDDLNQGPAAPTTVFGELARPEND